MLQVADHRIPAADGRALAGTLFEPRRRNPPATVLVLGATGVKRGYYGGFARHLAANGLRAVTVDYRGIGDSRDVPPRREPARMSDWARLDASGTLAWAGECFPSSRLLAVGHSFGGQGLGMVEGRELLSGVLLVAAQSGWWGHWRGSRRVAMWLLWHALTPVVCRAAGYFPARLLGMGEDLPGGVAREWASWGRRRDYLLGRRPELAADYADLELPLLALSFADDAYAPRPAVEALLAWYESAEVEHRHLRPEELGRPVGHFGFFREAGRDDLWKQATSWLRRRAA